MMKKIYALIGIITLCSIAVLHDMQDVQVVHAIGERSSKTCKDWIHRKLGREHRLFRAMLYGMPPATGAVIGTIRYDQTGSGYYKGANNDWYSIESESSISDDQMEATAEFTSQRGLFETKRALTSELIPYLAQSMYDFQCHIEKVCGVTGLSHLVPETDDPQEVVVDRITGCKTFVVDTYEGCHMGLTRHSDDLSELQGYCNDVGEAMIRREGEILKVAVEYDAAYRSMLQFAGNLDLFMAEFRAPLTQSVRHAANIISRFHEMPCFLSSCVEYPVEEDDFLPPQP